MERITYCLASAHPTASMKKNQTITNKQSATGVMEMALSFEEALGLRKQVEGSDRKKEER